jgi:GDP-mannose 4,6-dehydratase
MSNKRAFITGITGMVGSHLADYLIAETDWDIVGLCRWRSPLDNLQALVPRINANDRVELVYGDLRDTVSINKAVAAADPDYVFHLAAQSFPKTSFDAPLDTLDTNIQGTTRVLEALRTTRPDAVVHVCASSEVFGRVSKDQLPINEDCAFHPASPYAISKVGTDLIGRFYAEAYGMTVMTTRMFTHTGPRRGDVFAESTFAKQIAMIEHGLIPPVVKVGNLKSLRTVADVRDAVRAYHLLVTHNPVAGESYNIGGTYSCLVGDILDALLALSPRRDDIVIEVDPARQRPIDADLQVPDTTKFRTHTGWRPEIDFEQTMSDLLQYWRQQITSRGDAFLTR